MEQPRRHPYETSRLQELNSYQILDSSSETPFDDIVALASQICKVPIALVSLIDEDRQWFKARVGLEAVQTSRDISFCGHAILGEEIFEIRDAKMDKRFEDNPLVMGAPHIRFYAGAPLRTPSGLNMGTLCVIDREPRVLSEEQRMALASLARLTVEQMEMRKTNLGLQRLLASMTGQKVAARNRNEILNEYSSGLAHEINNPLAILVGLAEVIQLKSKDNEAIDKELMQMRGAINRVASVVNNLKNFAQDRTLPKKDNVSMEKILVKIRQNLTSLAFEKNVLVTWPQEAGAFVKGDEQQLAIAFENVIKNAIEAASEGHEKWVKLDTFVDKGIWVLKVTDSGPQMALNQIRKMYDVTLHPAADGRGLGLSIARGIISAHEGAIDLTGLEPTTIEIRLP